MVDWIKKNKQWLFSGVAVSIPLALIGWLWFQGGDPPPVPPDNSTQQTHSGTGDNVGGDKNVTTDNSVRQISIGATNVAGRDQTINNYLLGSVDYRQLVQAIKDAQELLAAIPSDKINLRLKQSGKVKELKQRLEDFKADVFRLHELFTRIPINTERLRKAKEHFDKGEFREADAVLKAEEIQRDVERLKKEKGATKEKLAAIERSLEERAQEFVLKARLSLLSPVPEGGSRFERAQGWFEQALATARTAELLGEYANFLQKHNAFGQAEPLYQEALKQYRSNAESDPNNFPYNYLGTLKDIGILYIKTNTFVPALEEYREALEVISGFAQEKPTASLRYSAEIFDNLAGLYTKINEYGLALETYQTALEFRRILAEAKPKVFLPGVARTLNNLATLHQTTGAFAQALQDYEEALRIYRDLAKKEPKEFLPGAASILSNIAILHKTTGASQPALKKHEEALKIRRGLAKDKPEKFLPDLANSLNNLATLHAEIGIFSPALKEFEEALAIYRGLAEKEPRAFLPYVGGTLSNLALLHSQLGAFTPALKKYEEALKIRRRLAKKEPGAFNQDLAQTLLNMSIFYLEDVPNKAKSVTYAQEARNILIPLCKKAPHLQGKLDRTKLVLKRNNAKPEA